MHSHTSYILLNTHTTSAQYAGPTLNTGRFFFFFVVWGVVVLEFFVVVFVCVFLFVFFK